MRRPSCRTVPAAAIAAALLLAAPGAAAASRSGVVHLRGTAYEFNNVGLRLAGATIGVAELPTARATTRPDGTYDLVVPDRTRVTPFIRAAGHHAISLQTFTTDGADLANVNFQTPSDAIYRALAALLDVPLDAAGDPQRCAIVSTFSTRDVRDLGFAGFIAYGAHGVAGATATALPSLPPPIYFNEQVVPDPAQRRSSQDGGVIWTGVPRGTYRITAHHPTARFASFVATCRPGRIVNANPPWGLHELGLANPARVSATWTRRGGVAVLRSLRVRALPARAVVAVRCTGRACPFRTRTSRASGRTLDAARGLGARARRLRAGQSLSVQVSAHRFDGTLVRWAVRRRGVPRAITRCVPLGERAARRVC
jgi:hypothetical protein